MQPAISVTGKYLYRACKRTGRTPVLDLYAAEVLAATGNPNIPQAEWPNVAIYVPQYQQRHVKRTERFDLTERRRSCSNRLRKFGFPKRLRYDSLSRLI